MIKNKWYVFIIAICFFSISLFFPLSLVTYLNYVGLHSLVCLGLVFLTGYIRVTSFGQAAFVGIGAYTTAILMASYGWNPFSALMLAMLFSAISAFVIGWLTINLAGHYLVLGTMAWGISIYLLFGNVAFFGGFNGISSIPSFDFVFFDFGIQNNYLILIWSLVALVFYGSCQSLKSRQGRAVRVLSDPLLSESYGINVNKLKIKTFVISAVFASISGWVSAHYLSVVNPGPFGVQASIDYLFMAVLGGVNSIFGALVGPAVVEALRIIIRDYSPSFLGVGGSFEIIIFGLIVIFILQKSRGGLVDFFKKIINFESKEKAFVINTRDGLEKRQKIEENGVILEIKNITKKFGGLTASNNINFDINYGELLGVIGPNGAGKSTLFNMLTGLLKPTSGDVIFQGKKITNSSALTISKLGIARTFQHVRLSADMTVLENVAIGTYGRSTVGLVSSALGLGKKQEERCLAEAYQQLQRVGLEHLAHMKAGNLALGQQRLVEIARALATDPVMLLLDEPAAGLRFQEKQHLAELLKKLKEERITVLLVEHDMQFVMQLADRLVVLQYGQRIAFGKTSDVQKDQKVIDAYLGVQEE